MTKEEYSSSSSSSKSSTTINSSKSSINNNLLVSTNILVLYVTCREYAKRVVQDEIEMRTVFMGYGNDRIGIV